MSLYMNVIVLVYSCQLLMLMGVITTIIQQLCVYFAIHYFNHLLLVLIVITVHKVVESPVSAWD